MRFDKISYTDVVADFHKWLDNIYQPFVYDNDTKEIKASDILYALDRDTYDAYFSTYCNEKHIMRVKIGMATTIGDEKLSIFDGGVDCYQQVLEEGDEEDA